MSQSTTIGQFDIVSHYNVMAELDQDVHNDEALAASEVNTALWLIGDKVPVKVFLPCFGTGRHIGPLLERGVQRIVGVDLSPACVAKAQQQFGNDSRVHLEVGDLRNWACPEQVDAILLLGNSFADCIDPDLQQQITRGMLSPLKPQGTFVMDYVGEDYLERCQRRVTSVWTATLNGQPVVDRRTPRFDSTNSVMTIDVAVYPPGEEVPIWTGNYQKRLYSVEGVEHHFAQHYIMAMPIGLATQIVPYYFSSTHELGMLAQSTWWVGRKESEVMGK